MSKEAMKLAASVLKGSQEYKRGHTTFVEAVEELEEALAHPAPVVNVQHKPTTYTDRFTHAVAVLCGAQPPAELVAEWFEDVAVNGGHRLQSWVGAQHATPSWAQCIVVLDAAHVLASDPEEGEGHETVKLAEQPAQRDPSQDGPDCEDGPDEEGFRGPRPWNGFDTTAPQPAPVAEPFLVRLYNQGYSTGHNDTVESCYTHVYSQDLDTYHSDAVAEWLVENPQAQPAQRKPLTLDQIGSIIDACEKNVKGEFLVEFARAIESKVKENT